MRLRSPSRHGFAVVRGEADNKTSQKMTTADQQHAHFTTGRHAPLDPEKNFSANYDGGKASEVFHVTELTEHILSFLGADVKSIIKATRVCKHLKDTFDSSEKLRTMTFFAPTPQDVTLHNMPQDFHRVKKMPEDIDDQDHHFFNCRLNPLLFEDTRFSRGYTNIATTLKRDSIFQLRKGSYSRGLTLGSGGRSTRLDLSFRSYNHKQRVLKIQKGSAMNMVLAYQPRPINLSLEFHHNERIKGYRTMHDLFDVTLAANITAGGLVNVVNSIWHCVRDPELVLGDDIAKEDVEKKAKRYWKSVVKWMESDVIYVEHWEAGDENDGDED